MKNFYRLIILIFFSLLFICCATSGINKFEKKDHYFDNKSVLGLNAINADYNYYTKAILEYLLVKEIIDGNSLVYEGAPKFDIKSKTDVTKILLFPKLKDFDSISSDKALSELKNRGVRYCDYDLPKKLSHLEGGFQFNHYIFQSNNRAAMQAFGIVDSEIRNQSLYIVTDYLQYKDIKCTGLPTIRYAVGMRAQFRISDTQSESDLKGIGSLAGLAAAVETNTKNVNITIKTIGITGLDSRLAIPSNTSFDVKTFSDYEKIIDFIRNLKDEGTNVIINPQIIPVMDEYRTTLEHTFHPLYESIEILEARISDLSKDDGIDIEELDAVKSTVNKIKLQLLHDEVVELKNNRDKLVLGNRYINDYSKYTDLILIINGLQGTSGNMNLEEFKEKINFAVNNAVPGYKVSSDRNADAAADYAIQGYNDLLLENFDSALKNFTEAENSCNGCKNYYEVSFYLRRLNSVADKDAAFWKRVYQKVATSWKLFLTPELQEKFNEKIR
jgi:hypothetical protein